MFDYDYRDGPGITVTMNNLAWNHNSAKAKILTNFLALLEPAAGLGIGFANGWPRGPTGSLRLRPSVFKEA